MVTEEDLAYLRKCTKHPPEVRQCGGGYAVFSDATQPCNAFATESEASHWARLNEKFLDAIFYQDAVDHPN
jgi:hypothetical protein